MATYLGSKLVNVSLSTSDWVRPSGWLSVPTPLSNQEFAGLIAVYPTDSNYVALSATVVSGSTAMSYSVDWGDGNRINYLSNTTAEYSHSYSLLPSSSYYADGNYRQAWVRVTPTGSLDTNNLKFTSINLQKKHSRSGLPTAPTVSWLDIFINGSNINSLTLGGSTVYLRNLQRCVISSGSLSGSFQNFSYMFAYCLSLQSVPLFDTRNGTNFSNMFRSCIALQSVPLFDTRNGTNFSNMFYNCYSLKTVPCFDTKNGTTFSGMFNGCFSLQSVPLFNTVSGSNFSDIFIYCNSLQSVPLFDTRNGTNFSGMFYNCNSLQYIPLFNTSNVGPGGFASTFTGDTTLRLGAMSGSKETISYSGCNLAKDEILNIFNYLGYPTHTSASVTMSLNHGVADLTGADSASVIAKGWAGVLY